MPVSNITQVVPGAAVSIVLKADQPTGRQVPGIVQDILTRGNHPRGIKVRLRDGRIGRVQRMHTGDLPASDPPQEPNPAVRGESHRHRSQRPRFMATDIRNEDGGGEPTSEVDLFAYVKQAKPKKRGGQKAQERVPDEVESEPAAVATCPVCGIFEGDETAVAHHVETHFG